MPCRLAFAAWESSKLCPQVHQHEPGKRPTKQAASHTSSLVKTPLPLPDLSRDKGETQMHIHKHRASLNPMPKRLHGHNTYDIEHRHHRSAHIRTYIHRSTIRRSPTRPNTLPIDGHQISIAGGVRLNTFGSLPWQPRADTSPPDSAPVSLKRNPRQKRQKKRVG